MARWRMLSASHIGPFRFQSQRLPFQPTINLGTSNRNRFISRSLKRDLCWVSTSGIRNHHGPLIATGARKNEKLNTLVVHGTRHSPRLKTLEGIVSKRKHSRYRSGRSRVACVQRHAQQVVEPVFGQIKQAEFVRELPTTESGKVQKYKLHERGVTETTWDHDAFPDRRTRHAEEMPPRPPSRVRC
jgi:hypothetical protein